MPFLLAAKSVLLMQHFGELSTVQWDEGAAVGSHFDSEEQAVRALTLVGLDSNIAQLLPATLSTGQLFLADTARMLGYSGSAMIIIDEFGCALDTASLWRLCRVLSSHVRGWVLATCRNDLVGPHALQPDWVYDTSSRTCSWLTKTQSVQKESLEAPTNDPCRAFDVPVVTLELRPCHPSAWDHFKAHHYKSEQLSTNAEAHVAHATVEVAGVTKTAVPVGFIATIRHAAKAATQAEAPRRAHRTVVLPEWQGLGLGSMISDAVAGYHFRQGREYYGQTVHPRQVLVCIV